MLWLAPELSYDISTRWPDPQIGTHNEKEHHHQNRSELEKNMYRENRQKTAVLADIILLSNWFDAWYFIDREIKITCAMDMDMWIFGSPANTEPNAEERNIS